MNGGLHTWNAADQFLCLLYRNPLFPSFPPSLLLQKHKFLFSLMIKSWFLLLTLYCSTLILIIQTISREEYKFKWKIHYYPKDPMTILSLSCSCTHTSLCGLIYYSHCLGNRDSRHSMTISLALYRAEEWSLRLFLKKPSPPVWPLFKYWIHSNPKSLEI